MISIEVRSSGWGPRARWTGEAHDSTGLEMLGDVIMNWLRRKWPRDGVAIIIRRES